MHRPQALQHGLAGGKQARMFLSLHCPPALAWSLWGLHFLGKKWGLAKGIICKWKRSRRKCPLWIRAVVAKRCSGPALSAGSRTPAPCTTLRAAGQRIGANHPNRRNTDTKHCSTGFLGTGPFNSPAYKEVESSVAIILVEETEALNR